MEDVESWCNCDEDVGDFDGYVHQLVDCFVRLGLDHA